MKKLLLGVVALAILALGGPATAADLPYKAAPPMVAPPSTWTGIYGGVALGGKWSKDDWATTCIDPFFLATCGSAVNSAVFPVDGSSPNSFSTTGFRAGGYFGANWQIMPTWLIGVEGDVAWSSQTSTVAGVVGCAATLGCTNAGVPLPGSTNANDSTSIKNGNDASARGRLGFLVTPDWLVYGTGGVAFQQVTASVSCNVTGPLCLVNGGASQSTTMMGWTVGGGIEWKFMRNWLIRGEYRYADFGDWRPQLASGPAFNIFTDIHVRTQIATFGIAYLFPVQ